MIPLKNLVEKIFRISLFDVAHKKGIESEIFKEISIHIERAREETFGDYACTSAMDKKIRNIINIKNPKELANLWVESLQELKISSSELIHDSIWQDLFQDSILSIQDIFEHFDVAGPGFINVFINKKVLFYYLIKAIQEPQLYGNLYNSNPKKIIFEFVSANPTGPLNIVSARAAALGDCCCNLLEAIGDSVYREYYVNDYGNQIVLLGISCLFRLLEKSGIPLKFSHKQNEKTMYPEQEGLPFPSEAYHGDYIQEALEEIIKQHKIKIPDEEINRLKEISKRTDLTEDDLSNILTPILNQIANQLSLYAVEYFVKLQVEDLKMFRVHFDNFFFESTLHKEGKVKEILNKLKPYIYKKDGKTFFRSSDFGDDQDRVVVRDNGNPTYLLSDIAYHNTKMERGFTHIINIWGPDHHGYIARLKGALQALGFPEENFRILIAQQVSLVENGKPIVMSKRTGKLIRMKELLEEIPIDVSRYFFVMRSFESHLEFDLNEAKDTSEKNPYYYVAYSHARISSIFRKIHEFQNSTFTQNDFLNMDIKSIDRDLESMHFSYTNMISKENLYRRNLLLKVSQFLEEIYESAINYEPHRLIYFLYQMANDVAKFYSLKENKVIEKSEEEARILLMVLYGVQICLKRGLNLLGMEAPEKLERNE